MNSGIVNSGGAENGHGATPASQIIRIPGYLWILWWSIRIPNLTVCGTDNRLFLGDFYLDDSSNLARPKTNVN